MTKQDTTRRRRKRYAVWPAVCLLAVIAIIGAAAYLLSPAPSQEDAPPVEAPPPEPEIMVVVRYATEEEQAQHDRETVEAVAQTVWGEARGCSTTEQAAVVWCILNRVDSPEFPDDPMWVVQQVVSGYKQFSGYSPDNPVEPDLVALVEDVMARWDMEKIAVGGVGRVLPADYLYFDGDGSHNHFRRDYIRTGETWDWGLASPYGGTKT